MKTIGFDLDGTILEIGERDYKIYCDLMVEAGCGCLPFDKYWSLRRDRTNIFEILQQSCYPGTLGEHFLVERDRRMESPEYLSMDSLFCDVEPAIRELKRAYRCVIVTKRHNKKSTADQITRMNIDSLFNDVVITDSGSKIDAYASVEKLCLIVGDTEKDIDAANGLHLPSVGMTTGIRNRQQLQSYRPTIILDNFMELQQYIDGNKL